MTALFLGQREKLREKHSSGPTCLSVFSVLEWHLKVIAACFLITSWSACCLVQYCGTRPQSQAASAFTHLSIWDPIRSGFTITFSVYTLGPLFLSQNKPFHPLPAREVGTILWRTTCHQFPSQSTRPCHYCVTADAFLFKTGWLSPGWFTQGLLRFWDPYVRLKPWISHLTTLCCVCV